MRLYGGVKIIDHYSIHCIILIKKKDMRKLKLLALLLLGGFLWVACGTEPVQEINEEVNVEYQKGLENIENGQKIVTDPLKFEYHLQWLSFTTTYLMKTDFETRATLSTQLDGDKTVQLSDLNGLQGNGFRSKLRTRLIYYFEFDGEPDTETTKPPTDPDPPFTGMSPEEMADALLAYVFDENCVEFFFPNGIAYPLGFTVVSVGHPMNEDKFNDGILRSDHPSWGIGLATEGLIVDQSLVQKGNMIVVARPYRDSGTVNIYCSYLDYPNVIFTDFLY